MLCGRSYRCPYTRPERCGMAMTGVHVHVSRNVTM